MKKIIGYLKELTGLYYAEDAEGHRREIHPGDPVYEGETVVDAQGSVVPDALRAGNEDTTASSMGEANVEAGTAQEESGKGEQKPESHHFPRSTEYEDHFDENYAEANINAPLHTAEWLNTNGGIIREEYEGEVNINAPLRRNNFENSEKDEEHYPGYPFPPDEHHNDVPIARPDVNDVTEDGEDADGYDDNNPDTTIVAGEIFPNDTFGADLPVTLREVSSNNTGTPGTIGTEFSGQYGTLKLNPDGTYIYTLDNTNPDVQHINEGETLSEIFGYTIADVDGDSSSTTLTITIHGQDDGVDVIIPDHDSGSGDEVVYESGLPDGSHQTGESSSVSSSFSFVALDGIGGPDGKITFNGNGTDFAFTESELSGASPSSPLDVETGEGVLHITGYSWDSTTGTGVIEYTYDLHDAQNHPPADGNNNLVDDITITVTDRDGSTASDVLDIRIVDDVPTARDDANSVTEDTVLQATGNVVTGGASTDVADTIGADQTATPVTAIHSNNTNTDGTVGSALTGGYGALTLNADGSYTYDLDNSNVDVQHLIPGETLTETYTYTITDADGDTSEATLTITINGTDDQPDIDAIDGNDNDPHSNGDATVYESALSTGSDPSSSQEQTTGTIVVDAKDGLDKVTIGGTDIDQAALLASGTTPITINTTYGTIEINGFDPDDPTHADGSGTIHYTYTLTGNTTDHSAAGDDEVTDAIAVGVTDRNGDTSSDTLNVTIVDDVPTARDNEATVVEGGSQVSGNIITDNDPTSGTDIPGADGATLHTIEYTDTNGDTQTFTFSSGADETLNTQTGTLVINRNGDWKFTPVAQYDHDDDPSGVGNEDNDAYGGSFKYTLIDGDGDVSNEAEMKIDVTDTIGSIEPVTISFDEDDLANGSSPDSSKLILSNQALGIVKGADDITDVEFVDADVQAFVSGFTSDGQALDYTITNDHDLSVFIAGDPTQEIFTMTINPDSGGDYNESSTYTFELKGVLDHPSSGEDILAVNVPFSAIETDDVISGNVRVDVIDDVPTAVDDAPQSIVEGQDTDGTPGIDSLGGNVITDASTPDVQGADGAKLSDFTYIDGNTGSSTTVDLTDGADHTVTTPTGTLTVNADGTWSFTPVAAFDHDNRLGVDPEDHATNGSFTYTLKDFDGDTSTGLQTIDVLDGNDPSAADVAAAVDEDDIPNIGSDGTQSNVVTGNFSVTGGSDPIEKVEFTTNGSGNFTSNGIAIDYSWDAGTQTLTGTAGSATIFTAKVTGTPDNPGYEFTLLGSIDHAAPTSGADENTILLPLEYKATDWDGDVATANLNVTITDDISAINDAPLSSVDEDDLPEGSQPDPKDSTVVVGNFTVTQGADTTDVTFDMAEGDSGITSGGGDTVYYWLDNTGHVLTASTSDTESGVTASNTIYQVTMTDPSTDTAGYEFELFQSIDHDPGSGENHKDLNFDVKITDYDGDVDPAAFTVRVIDDVPVIPDSIETNEDTSYQWNVSADTVSITINESPKHGSISYTIIDSHKIIYIPHEDYSGPDSFKITVTDADGDTITKTVNVTVNPVADAPDMQDDLTVSTEEDTSNNNEGGDIKVIGLELPGQSKDQTDQSDAGSGDNFDAPERLGLINFDFSDSRNSAAIGAKVMYDSDGDGVADKVLMKLGTDPNTFSVRIDDPTLPDYHPTGDIGTANFKLTKAQYESISINHAEDNASNIYFTVSVSSHEVQQDGSLWSPDVVSAPKVQHVTFDVQAVTDPVSITLTDTDDSATDPESGVDNVTIDNASEFTLNIKEDTTVNLTDILGENFGDQDNSETYKYKFEGLPEGTVVKVDGVAGFVNASGSVTIDFGTHKTPDVSITPPDNFSGDITGATITLIAHDHEPAGEPDNDPQIADETASVTLNMHVAPVADPLIVSIAQSVGFEDQGRNPDGTVDTTSAPNGILLDAKVWSADSDETFNVLFDKIPDDAAIYYGGQVITKTTTGLPDVGPGPNNSGTDLPAIVDNGDGTWGLWIQDYDYTTDQPILIPPHNSNVDVDIKVSGYAVDTATVDGTTVTDTSPVSDEYTIKVVIDGVADEAVNTDLHLYEIAGDDDGMDLDGDGNNGLTNITYTEDPNGDYSAIAVEDSSSNGIGAEFNLKDIYKANDDTTDNVKIDSYDNLKTNDPDQHIVDTAVSDPNAAPDDIASEALSITLTGLDARFNVQGATMVGGSGETRIWVMSEEQIANGDVTITTPEHFSGEIDFTMNYITTEDDGASLTSPDQNVTLLVTPVVEATVDDLPDHLAVNEDTLTHVDLNLDIQSPDADEVITALWINKADVDDKDFTLFIGDDRSTLVTDSTVVNIGGTDYYKIDNGDWANLYVQYDPDIGGEEASIPLDTTFGYKYQVSDFADAHQNGNPVTISDSAVSPYQDAVYTFDLSPVTDDIDAELASVTATDSGDIDVSGSDITIHRDTTITVSLTIEGVDEVGEVDPDDPGSTTNGLDDDGSEQIEHIRVEGVPNGIGLENGHYVGDVVGQPDTGIWYVDLPSPIVMDGSTKSLDLNFIVSGDDATYTASPATVTISVINQDGSATAVHDDVELNFIKADDYVSTNTDAPMDIGGSTDVDTDGYTEDPAFAGFVEDTATRLGDVMYVDVDAVQNDELGRPVTSNLFSITVEGLEHATVNANGGLVTDDNPSGWVAEINEADGTTMYTYRGEVPAGGDANDVIEAALNELEITPDYENYNSNNTPAGEQLKFTTTLTTYTASGIKDVVTYNYSGDVKPVTDPVRIVPEFTDDTGAHVTEATEDELMHINLQVESVDNSFDPDGDGTNNVYATIQGNVTLTYDASNTFGVTVNGTHLYPGDSIDIAPADLGNITFQADLHESGTSTFSYSITSLEDNADNTETTTGTLSIDIAPVADGLDVSNVTAHGNEDQFIEILSDGAPITDNLIDNNSNNTTPETLTTLMVTGIPDGYTVYTGEDGSQVLAQNLGGDGTTNRWNIDISGGSIPRIWLKAPENVGGVSSDPDDDGLGNVKLVSGVTDGGETLYAEVPIDVAVEAVADSVTINPSGAVGYEGGITLLRLNVAADDTDGSEYFEITVKDLGPSAVFYLGGTEIMGTDAITGADKITYDEASDTYTIRDSNIDFNTVDELGFIQNDFTGDLTIGIKAIEKSNGNEGLAETDKTAAAQILDQVATDNDDTLLYDTKGVDGKDGTDTIIFGTDWNHDITIDFTALTNVEILDLNEHGDHNLGTLTLNDVVNMTDADNDLSILGDNGDSVTLSGNWQAGANSNGLVEYTNSDDPTVLLKVDEDIQVTVA